MSDLRYAAENVLIAYGMGWDLDVAMEQLQEALEALRKEAEGE